MSPMINVLWPKKKVKPIVLCERPKNMSVPKLIHRSPLKSNP